MANVRGTPRYGVIRPVARPSVVEDIVPNSAWTEDSAAHYLVVDLPEFVKEDVKLQVDSSGRIVVKGERQASEQKRVRFHLSFPEPNDSEIDNIAGKFDGGILYVTLPKRIVQENNKESDTEKAGIHDVKRAEEIGSHTTNADDDSRDHNQHVGHVEREDDHNQHVGRVEHEDDHNQHVRHVEHEDDHNQHVGHEEHEHKQIENAHMRDFSEQVMRKWDQETMLRSALDVLMKNKGIVATAVIAFSLGMYVSSKFQFSEAP
uniref:SHSP domain-containing protein n=1 Tax=Medicago truncatula TaxID=3880 RepID=B7FK78_MEDTR|nr:unknown [Medicago truncatula]